MSISTLRTVRVLIGMVRVLDGSERAAVSAISGHSIPRLLAASRASAMVMVLTCGVVLAQAPERGTVAFRPLEAFRYLHVPEAGGDQGKLSREFLNRMQSRAPFDWKPNHRFRLTRGPISCWRRFGSIPRSTPV